MERYGIDGDEDAEKILKRVNPDLRFLFFKNLERAYEIKFYFSQKGKKYFGILVLYKNGENPKIISSEETDIEKLKTFNLEHLFD